MGIREFLKLPPSKVQVLEKKLADLEQRATLNDLIFELRKTGVLTGDTGIVSTVSDAIATEPVFARTVKLIVDTLKYIPVKIKRESTNEDVENKELMRIFSQPNLLDPKFTFVNLMERSLWGMLKYGNQGYLKDVNNPISRVRNFVPLSEKLKPILKTDADRYDPWLPEIVKFDLNDKPYNKDEIIWVYNYSATNGIKGESPLTAAVESAGMNVSLRSTLKNFFDHKGTPGLKVQPVQGAKMDKTVQDNIRSELRNRHTGARNAGHDLINPDGNITIEEFQSKLGEVAYGTAYEQNWKGIAILAGIPWIVLEASDSTYTNLEQAKYFMLDSTFKPLLSKFAEQFTLEIVKTWDKNLYLMFDTSGLESAIGKMQAQAQAASSIKGWSVNEIRVKVWGLPPLEGEEGNTVWLGEGAMALPVGQAPPPESASRKVEEKPLSRLSKGLGLLGSKIVREEKPKEELKRKASGGFTGEQREAWYQERKADFIGYRQSFALNLKKNYKDQRKRIEKYIETLPDDLRGIKDVDSWLKWVDEEKKFNAFAHPILLWITDNSAKKVFKDFEITETHKDRVTTFSRKFAEEVNETTKKKLKEALDKILNEREIREDEEKKPKKKWLLEALGALFLIATTSRTDLAADSETHNAQGYGLTEGAKQGGFTYKQWLSAFKPTSRDGHMDADGQIREINEPFNVVSPGGENQLLMYPGDPTLGASVDNLANCYCTVMISQEGD